MSLGNIKTPVWNLSNMQKLNAAAKERKKDDEMTFVHRIRSVVLACRANNVPEVKELLPNMESGVEGRMLLVRFLFLFKSVTHLT